MHPGILVCYRTSCAIDSLISMNLWLPVLNSAKLTLSLAKRSIIRLEQLSAIIALSPNFNIAFPTFSYLTTSRTNM